LSVTVMWVRWWAKRKKASASTIDIAS
jgi:hypothetical protein